MRPHAVAIIHARGGSKRVPLKNLKLLGGKPLIAWCVEAARASTLDRVIVSTDHDGIAQAALDAGAEVPFRRPPALSEDVPSEEVTQHGIEMHEAETGRVVDLAVTIQPTTPFLRAKDIDDCLALMANADHDSALTVGPVEQRPEWMYRRAPSGTLSSLMNKVIQGEAGVSQSLEPLFHPNGACYVTRRATLFDEKLIIGRRPAGVVMSRLRSVDIDEPIDFLVAEVVARELASSELP